MSVTGTKNSHMKSVSMTTDTCCTDRPIPLLFLVTTFLLSFSRVSGLVKPMMFYVLKEFEGMACD